MYLEYAHGVDVDRDVHSLVRLAGAEVIDAESGDVFGGLRFDEDVIAEVLLEARKHARRGRKDLYPLCAPLFTKLHEVEEELLRNPDHFRLTLTPNEHIRHTHERRIRKIMAQFQLLLKESLTIIAGCGSDGVIMRTVGLHDHLARKIGTTRAPGHLLDQIEGALRAAEIGKVEHGVGVDNTHERNIVEVESFRDHLRT